MIKEEKIFENLNIFFSVYFYIFIYSWIYLT